MVAIWLLACSTTPSGPTGDPAAFRAVVASTLTRLDTPPDDLWTPDVRLDLSPSAFATLVTSSYTRKASQQQGVVEFDGARLTNEAQLLSTTLNPEFVQCGDAPCLELELELSGTVSATTSEGSGVSRFHARSKVQFKTAVRDVQGTQEVYATTYGVALDLFWDAPDSPLAGLITTPTKQWLGKRLIDTPDLVLARSQQEPLARALRGELRDGGLTVELLTDRTNGGLPAREPLPNSGFVLSTTPELFIHLASSFSFERKSRSEVQIVGLEGNSHGVAVDVRSWSPTDGVYTDNRVRSRLDVEPPWRPNGPLNNKRKQQAAKHTRLRLITPEWTQTTGGTNTPAKLSQSSTIHLEAALSWAAGVSLPDIAGIPSAPTSPVLSGLTATDTLIQFTGELPATP